MNENPRGRELEGHLSPEILAVLAERGREGASLETLEHLARCRSCMSAYADIVRYRAGWLAFPEAFDGEETVPRPPAQEPAAHTWRRSAWAPAAAAAVILVGLAIVWRARTAEPPRAAEPVAALMESASAEGPVIPGGEAGAARRGSRYREGSEQPEGIEAVLDRMRTDYESSRGSGADVHPLAAALVAAGQVDLARNYIAEGLARSPSDDQLLTLAGIVAYDSGDYPLAERKLRAALESSPDNLTAMLDLGIVLTESRGLNDARPYLNEVVRRAPRSPLAERARWILAGHSQR